ncbi:MAG: sigma-70 family RNA polymerase sigma factor, partial [Clostridia bacterium]|nr:sigma-70 family RNA polymerase sigma factor [Clostridia bacterium]
MLDITDLVEKAKNDDSESMELILKSFKPKVNAICREYFLIGSDFDDILQEGMIGLYKAIMNYNKEKNDNFSNFATMCIHHQIQSAVKIANSKKNMPLNDYFSINDNGEVSNNEHIPQIILVTKNRTAEKISLEKE